MKNPESRLQTQGARTGGPGGEAPPAGGLGAWPPENTSTRPVRALRGHSPPIACPRCDSNAHWTGFESVASADWATGACVVTVEDGRWGLFGCCWADHVGMRGGGR